jgi:hypothetical protein
MACYGVFVQKSNAVGCNTVAAAGQAMKGRHTLGGSPKLIDYTAPVSDRMI